MSQEKKGDKAMNQAIKGTEAIRSWTDHIIKIEELVSQLGTHIEKGMTSTDADKRLAEDGKNTLSEKDVLPWYCVFLHELTGFFSLLLWFGGILCFVAYGISAEKEDKSNLYLGIVLVTVVMITGIFSYQQTSKSAQMMAQFKNFIPPEAVVVRDG